MSTVSMVGDIALPRLPSVENTTASASAHRLPSLLEKLNVTVSPLVFAYKVIWYRAVP
jgi:hypothetical protein